MTWFKVDDNLATHMKVISAGNEAMGLWVRAGSWAAQQLTDGYVPKAIVNLLGDEPSAEKLVEVGLWHYAKDGYEFNDWGIYQPTRAAVMGDREAAKERQRKYREGLKVSTHEPPNVSGEPEAKTPRSRGTRLPADFKPDDKLVAWARENVPNLDLRAELDKFVDYWNAQPGQKGVKTDWPGTWRNWMRRAHQDLPGNKFIKPSVPQPPTKEELEATLCNKHRGYPLPCDRCREETQ